MSAAFPGKDEFLELPNNVLNGIAQIHQRLNKWKCLEELNIAKEYIQGRLGVWVDFKGEAGVKSRKKFSSSIWPHVKFAICQTRDKIAVWLINLNLPNFGNSHNRGELDMFVGIVEPIKTVKFLANPTFKCFESEKEFLRISTRCFYSITYGFIFVPFPAKRKSSTGFQMGRV